VKEGQDRQPVEPVATGNQQAKSRYLDRVREAHVGKKQDNSDGLGKADIRGGADFNYHEKSSSGPIDIDAMIKVQQAIEIVDKGDDALGLQQHRESQVTPGWPGLHPQSQGQSPTGRIVLQEPGDQETSPLAGGDARRGAEGSLRPHAQASEQTRAPPSKEIDPGYMGSPSKPNLKDMTISTIGKPRRTSAKSET